MDKLDKMRYGFLLLLCLSCCVLLEAQTERIEIDLADIEVFDTADDKPRFPGCEEVDGVKARRDCAKEKYKTYIYDHQIYPPDAKRRNIQGTCVVKFVVMPDSTIVNIELVKGVSEDIDEHAMDLIHSMNTMRQRWIPGKNDGEAVPVRQIMAIKFRKEKQNIKHSDIRYGG